MGTIAKIEAKLFEDFVESVIVNQPVKIELPFIDVMVIIAQMQLGAKHPLSKDDQRATEVRKSIIAGITENNPAAKAWYEYMESKVNNAKKYMDPTCANMQNMIKTIFGLDEEMFVLRAKDKLSTLAVLYYKSIAIENNRSDEFVQRVTEHLNKMFDWQENNPEKVRLPD